MKKYHSILVSVALACGVASSASANSLAAPPEQPTFTKGDAATYGRQLADYMDRYNSGWVDQYFKAQMTLYDARGDAVRRSITQQVLEGARGDKSLVRFLSPAEIRGVAALVHEKPRSTDDSWLYLPSSRRVRRISGANRTASFQGTEFTYEDLSSLIIDKYRWKHLKNAALRSDGKSARVFVLEARPTYSDTGYSKLQVHVNQQTWRVEQIEYFDKGGRKLKTLRYSSWTHLHKRFWRARRLDMTNHQTKKRTVIAIKSLFLDLSRYPNKSGKSRNNLSSSQFSRRALERR